MAGLAGVCALSAIKAEYGMFAGSFAGHRKERNTVEKEAGGLCAYSVLHQEVCVLRFFVGSGGEGGAGAVREGAAM